MTSDDRPGSSAPGTPGANDNASGVAAVLALAQRLGVREHARTLRFVLIANEEPPFFKNPGMGSLAHARAARGRDEPIAGMLAIESIGFYSDEQDSQRYPGALRALFPSQGNFIGHARIGKLHVPSDMSRDRR